MSGARTLRAEVASILEGRSSAVDFLRRAERGRGADTSIAPRLSAELDRVERDQRLRALFAMAVCAPGYSQAAFHWLLERRAVADGTARMRAAAAVVLGAGRDRAGELWVLARALDGVCRGGVDGKARAAEELLGAAKALGALGAGRAAQAMVAVLALARGDAAAAAEALSVAGEWAGGRASQGRLGLLWSAAHEIAGRPRLALLALEDSRHRRALGPGTAAARAVLSEWSLATALCERARARAAKARLFGAGLDPARMAALCSGRRAFEVSLSKGRSARLRPSAGAFEEGRDGWTR